LTVQGCHGSAISRGFSCLTDVMIIEASRLITVQDNVGLLTEVIVRYRQM